MEWAIYRALKDMKWKYLQSGRLEVISFLDHNSQETQNINFSPEVYAYQHTVHL